MNTSTTLLPVLVLSAACGGSGPDLPGAEPLECEGPRETRTFRVDAVDLPEDADEAQESGVDLDGDGTVDNQAGNLFSVLLAVYPDLATTLEPQIAARLADDVEWLIGIEHCDGEARVSLGNPDHEGARATGSWDLGELSAAQGQGLAPIGALADLGGTGFDAWHATFPTSIELQIEGDRAAGRLAGAIRPGYVPVIAEAARPYLQDRLDAGQSEWAGEADTDRDGVLTTDEIMSSFEFSALTRADLEEGSYSFGFAVEAVALD